MTSNKNDEFTSVDCEVVHMETSGDLIVRTSDGRNVNIETKLPDVTPERKGKLLTLDGKTIFIREPYGGDGFR